MKSVTSEFTLALRKAAERMQEDAKEQAYLNDPVLWAEEKVGLILWSKQKEILRSVAENKRTAVKSCHSIGKTFISAVAAAWWVETRDNCMVQSTAPTYQQVHTLLWEEIRKLHHSAGLVGRVNLQDQWLKEIVKEGRKQQVVVGEGKKPADGNIHGFHGTHRPDGVLAIYDEGCGVAEAIFTGGEAITTGNHDRQLTVGNPDDPATEFGKIFNEKADKWNLITVSAFDTPNFTTEGAELLKKYNGDPEKLALVKAMLAGMPQPETVEDQKDLWGEESPRYMSKVLAQFPLVSEDSLFTPAEIATGLSNKIDPDDKSFRVLGVDPARYGNDKAALVLCADGHIEVVQTYTSSDLMQLAAQVHKYALDLKVDQVRVDSIGVGGGVIDRLVALNNASGKTYVVVEMVASTTNIPDKTLHRNARAYWYDSFKHKLRSGKIDLPDNRELLDEMSRVRYEYPNGVMKIESKDDMRKRGVHSPDILDAAVMAAAPIASFNNNPLASARPGQQFNVNLFQRVRSVSPY